MKKKAIINSSEDVTKDVIDGWKKEHGDVFEIIIEAKKGFFKKPDRKTLGAAMAFGKTNPLKFNETIINNTFLGGDVEMIEDDSYFLSLCAKIDVLVKYKEGEVKKH